MAVVIRLRRTGRKNLPCYRINVADSRCPRDGRMIETIGVYDPLRKDPAKQLVIDGERAKHWVDNGAQVSEVVQALFKRQGLALIKPHTPRERPGRSGRRTKSRANRAARAERMAKAKEARRTERLQARRAAAKAAKAAGAEAAKA